MVINLLNVSKLTVYMCMHISPCVRVCVRAYVWACVHALMCVYMGIVKIYHRNGTFDGHSSLAIWLQTQINEYLVWQIGKELLKILPQCPFEWWLEFGNQRKPCLTVTVECSYHLNSRYYMSTWPMYKCVCVCVCVCVRVHVCVHVYTHIYVCAQAFTLQATHMIITQNI